jgi:MFS family permease
MTQRDDVGRRASASAPVRATDWRSFLILWFGQTISSIGTNATYYGLGIWTFQETGSTSSLSLIILAALFPQLAVLPFTGALIDRYDRRKLMLFSDTGAAVVTGILVVMFHSDRLTVVSLGVFVAIGSLFQGIQAPAVNAVATQLIEPAQRGRAAGLSQVGRAVPTVFGPIIAGTMVAAFGVVGVFFVDLLTFVIAVGTLWMVAIPATQRTVEGQRGLGSVRSEATAAVRYLRTKPGLIYLMVYVAMANFALAFFNVYIFPVLLGVGDERLLGVVAGLGSLGMMAGAALMSVWGGPQRRMPLVYFGGVVMTAGMVAFGLSRSALALGVSLVVLFFALAVGNSSTQPIWQAKVEEDLQGRVFSIRRFVSAATMPVSYLLAGPLVDNVLNPLVESGRTGLFPTIVGTGEGRGAAAGIVIIAVVGLTSTLWGWAVRPLREIETDLPDVA